MSEEAVVNSKVKATSKRVSPGFVLVAASDVFPTTKHKTKLVLKTKTDWIDSNQLWLDTKTNRVFTPVILGSGTYWMDAITGSVYNVYTGQCQSNSSMCINLRHMTLAQEVCGEILLATHSAEGSDE
jgi:hypothetical protein